MEAVTHYVMGRPSEWLPRQDLLHAGTLLRGLREFLHKMLTGACELQAVIVTHPTDKGGEGERSVTELMP